MSGPRGTDAWIVQMRLAAEGDADRRTSGPRGSPAGPAPGHRPWELFFVRSPLWPGAIPGPVPDLAGCAARLRLALEGNRDFAARWRLQPWETYFETARAALAGDPPPRPDLPDVARPDVFGDAANRLLAAAARSWCFGGMGSWNDVVVADDAEQDRQAALASELHAAVVDSIEQATWPAVTVPAGR